MPAEPISLPVLDSTAPLRITPTDISQFVRHEQCERFLRLRLTERAGHDFMPPAGVVPQRITPLMSQSGSSFEHAVEAAIHRRFRCEHFAMQAKQSHGRSANNAAMIAEAIALKPGDVVILLQTRLEVALGGWLLRGDVDLIKFTRDDSGRLQVLIADMKSTTEVKVEHRLQVTFYDLMIAELFRTAGVANAAQRTAILYRPPIDPPETDRLALDQQRQAARDEFGLDDQLLAMIDDRPAYEQAARDLLLAPDSTARRIACREFDSLPYALSFKCDDCLYTEFCMKSSALAEDLSLLPYMTGTDKEALRRTGITTIAELATLKQPVADNPRELVTAPGRDELVRRIAATWPVGPRLDELIHRARRFRASMKKDEMPSLSYIPGSRNSSLPITTTELNPNLLWIYLDAQHDPLEGRIYLLGARVVACDNGERVDHRTIVHMTEGPPGSEANERDLFVAWTRDLLHAVCEIARSAEEPKKAPIHVVFFDSYEQRLMLEGLARNFPAMLHESPPLYDFLTQLASFDSPVASFLDEEVRAAMNYPMTCQSLQSLATYLRFDWNTPYPFRELFNARLFDYLGRLDVDGESEWYTRRARFASTIPAEYAYAAWGQLPATAPERGDVFADFRPVTRQHLLAFQQRRLEAMEHVAQRLNGNPNTTKGVYTLPNLDRFQEQARNLADALDEFIHIERMVTLTDWKATRHAPPEQRVLMGECLLVRYVEDDQDPGIAEQNRENERRVQRRHAYETEFRAQNPNKRITWPADCKWSQEKMRFSLRIETTGIDCALEELLLLSNLREGTTVVIFPRWTVDERLPVEERKRFTPTPRQMLYGQRANLVRVAVTERDATGRATTALAVIEMLPSRGSPATVPYVFGSFDRPLHADEVYTLDACPNEWYAYWCAKVIEGLRSGSRNVLYDRLLAPPAPGDASGSPGQQQFLAGLDAFREAGLLHDFEPGKRTFIGGHATTPILMVQGPPGTGKSYSTAFAVFARLQEAMRANCNGRVFLTCKTHAATDVLLENILTVQQRLGQLREQNRALFDAYFDPRLLSVPLYRIAPREIPPEGIIPLAKDGEDDSAEEYNADVIMQDAWVIAGVTPGGIYRMLKDRFKKSIFGHELCDWLVLDEASQMNLPEALLAALPLKKDARIIVVGDHRQMPPIVKHDWDTEARRTFQQYQVYRSLFDMLRGQSPRPPMIQFQESFRLHRAMAEFLCREVYRHDGIDYHSQRQDVLPAQSVADEFAAAVLNPDFPLVVVIHDEATSQVRNPFEQELIAPILRALTDPAAFGLNPSDGLGVVVPHRAQRAALQQAFPELSVIDPATGLPMRSAVDTVERFQGGERTVVMVSATESDRGYLLSSAGFLLDPRRLTVAVSRAKQKMILVAARSVFALFSPDEETFTHALLWKNLLARTCTQELWSGQRQNVRVQVWGGR